MGKFSMPFNTIICKTSVEIRTSREKAEDKCLISKKAEDAK